MSKPEQTSNIWRVEKESQIDKILTNHQNKIIMTVFSYDDPALKLFLKKQLATQFQDCLFVLALVDMPGLEKKHNFVADRGTYVQELKGKQLPFVFFHYNGKCVTSIISAESSVMLNTLTKLRTMLQQQQSSIQNQIQQTKLAQEHQVERMTQQRKIHELEELEKMRKIKEAQEAQEAQTAQATHGTQATQATQATHATHVQGHTQGQGTTTTTTTNTKIKKKN
jgi:hypothetical protein